jgi:hypothetical protein
VVEIWMERPVKADVEAVLRRYFGLLRGGRIPEAEQLVEHTPVRHVLRALWKGSVGASEDDEADSRLAAGEWERDLSWLGDIDLGNFSWGHTGSHVSAEVTYRAQTIEVALSFWVKQTDDGWIVSGPATLW